MVLAAAVGLAGGAGLAAEGAETEMAPAATKLERSQEELDSDYFRPDPTYEDKAYDAESQIEIYGGKREVVGPRPLLEIGRPQYTEGPFQPGTNLVGRKNLLFDALAFYGDWRTAVAHNDNGDNEVTQIATRLNIDIDFKLTATERVHALLRPIDGGGRFSRLEFAGDDGDGKVTLETDLHFDTLFFEGDVGAIVAGLADSYQSWDLPFAAGFFPIFFQNGIWADDAIVGLAATIPARNYRALDISNMDVTAFVAIDDVQNRGIGNNNEHNLNIYGVAVFVDALLGYFEGGAAYVDGEDALADQSFVSLTAAFTRRYRNWLSNSVRLFWNFGQDTDGSPQTVDGWAILVENSLITSLPTTLVPYFNFWIGNDRPQPLARGADGLLKNVGITFETDALTGFPKLDDTANDTFGGAIGVEYLFALDQQIVVEVATVQTYGSDTGRPAQDDQYAFGVRWQLPISQAWILRADAIYGLLVDQPDIKGIRFEVRRKF